MKAEVVFAGHYFCTAGFVFEQRICFSMVPVQHASEALKLVNAFEK